jgi:agmatine/peptidylarginine deiminase
MEEKVMKSFLVIKKAKTSVSLLLALFAMAAFIMPSVTQASRLVNQDYLDSIVDTNPNPVPHWATPEDEAYIQQLQEGGVIKPLGVEVEEPPSGTIWTPAEYNSVLGPLVAWEPGSYLSLLTEFVVGVTTDSSGSIAYVIVSGSSQQASATTTLSGAGANMSRVEFLYYNLDTVWIRDYGPRYILEDGLPAIIDHTYNRNRPADNAFPDSVDDMPVPFEQDEPVYLMDLTHGGGNFHVFSNGDAFMSSLILEENSSKSQAEIESIIESYFNVNVTIYNRLPSNVDATGHIDMWFLPVGDNKVIIGEFPSGAPGYSQTEAAAADMASRGYTVYRTPSYNSGSGGINGTHYTYTNAAIVNDRVYIPEYGGTHAADDATALAVFQAAMPGHEIIQVNCSSIISAAGAVHCVMKHVYTPLPTAPTITSTPVTIGGVGRLYSYDVDASGYPKPTFSLETYPAGMTIDPNTGLIEWTPSSTGDVNVVVRATNSEGYDEQNFTISVSVITEVVYDYTGITNPSGSHKAQDGEIDVSDSMIQNGTFPARQGTGITGWALWAEATTAEYAALLTSDNTRYSTADPGSGDNAAMLFEFYVNEEPEDVTQIDVSVEIGRGASTDLGYAYLWNYSTNSYIVLGSQSGTADQVVSATITTNPGDYIDPTTGQVTVFVVNMDDSDVIRVDQIYITIYSAPTPVMQTLSVSSTSGGSVTTPGEGDYQYAQGTDANIVAAADLHYHFVNWTGDTGTINDVNAANTTITMNANYTIQANFAVNQYTISGNTGVGDVTLEGLGIVSDGSGNYTKTVDYGWSGTVTPSKAGYTFAPTSRTYTDVAEDHIGDDYAATLLTYTISGNTGVGDVMLEGLGIVSDGSGNYTKTVDYGWSGTVTPSKTGYTFAPTNRTYTDVAEDHIGDDYTATLNTYIISGHIMNECDEPIEGVLVDANNGGGEDTTDVDGFYEVEVDYNWSGTVTPSKEQYTFEPNQMSYVNVFADQPDQDYTAYHIYDLYDLDYDCHIGWGDVAVIGENWLDIGEDIPGDFYEDDANTVNFLDFADFANIWKN